ncbi:hypothetical protein GGR58DRAFT_467634 [Xylaria digitata]|nr:hypothetical protein GGR58DRAFT_467634 [Xylaria digitata]
MIHFPEAAGARQGCKDLPRVLSCSSNTWACPLKFLPERFLVGPEHELYPPKEAWRAFEIGVRNYTGQVVAMKELREFIALVARGFDLLECYDKAYAGEKIDLLHVYNERVFLIESVFSAPQRGVPIRISGSHYASASS